MIEVEHPTLGVLEFPDGTAPEQMKAAIQKAEQSAPQQAAPAQSEPEPYKASVSDAERQQLRPEESGDIGGFQLPNELEGDSTGTQRFRVAAGLMSTHDPMRQMRIIGEAFPGVVFDKDEEGNFIVDARPIGGSRGYLNEPGLDARDMTKFAGNVLALMPAGRLAGGGALLMQGARIGAGSAALQGGLDMANQAIGGEEEVSAGNINKSDVAIAGAGGLASPYIAKALSGVVGRIGSRLGRGTSQVVDDTGQLTDDAMRTLKEAKVSPQQLNQQVVRQLQQEGVLTPEQAANFNLFRSQGVRPTMANLTQTADDWQLQQEAMKRSTPLRAVADSQDEALAGRVGQLADDTGGQTGGALDTGEQVFNAVTRKATDLDRQIGGLYREAAQRAGDDMVVDFQALINQMKNTAGRNELSGGMVKAVRQELVNRGLMNAKWQPAGRAGVRTAEEIRQVLNSFYDGASPQGRNLISLYKNALDDDVMRTAGDDLFAQARKARAQFSRDLERAKLSKFDKGGESLLEKVLANKISPDQLFEKIVVNKSARSSDVKALKDYLLSGTDEQIAQGTQAWNSLRAETMRHLLNKATGTAGKIEGGGSVFNGNQFRKAMDQVGLERLRTLFTPEEFKQIAAIRKIGELRIPVSMTQQGKGPSAQAIGELADRIPGIEQIKAILSVPAKIGENRAINRAADPAAQTVKALTGPTAKPAIGQAAAGSGAVYLQD
tara:strand:- start:5622 stop:7781 length:2160 start_codon:yes stop_codon:yes gene_type:complete